MRHGMTWFLTGLGAGAAAMYFYDPNQGARRRAEIQDRTMRSLHDAEDLAGKAGRDARNRARGLAARSRAALQGGYAGPRHGTSLRVTTPAVRLGEGILGGVLALWGIGHRGILGMPIGLAGLALLARAGIETVRGDHGDMIRVQKTITVAAPPAEVFQYWSRFENFPRFMQHVVEVTSRGQRQWHWKVAGPAGIPVEWDAEITDLVPDRKICWQSVEGSSVEQSGEVQFEAMPDGGTRIHVRLAYCPPGGVLGHVAASFLGGDPKTLMDDDLLRLKSLLETGKATARGQETYRPTMS